MLDLGALHAFYWVGRLGGVGAAARELKVTQSAVSQRLKKLEGQFGRRLYGRAGRRLVLTEDGERLLQVCRQVFDLLGSAEAGLRGESTPVLGAVRIASLSEFGKAFLVPRLVAFRRLHPSVEFDLRYAQPYEMLASLSRHEVDFVLTNELYQRPQIESVAVFREEVLCVGPRPARRLSWKDLERLPWLSYGEEDPLWYEFERQAARRGTALPGPVVRAAEMETVLRLAAAGVGYALAPRHAVALRTLRGLAVHRLPMPAQSRWVYLCRLRTVPLGQASRTFWDFLRKER